jgi:hypothetical protein
MSMYVRIPRKHVVRDGRTWCFRVWVGPYTLGLKVSLRKRPVLWAHLWHARDTRYG